MTTIYLVRHGEAEGNAFRRIHGQYDSILTPTGFRQAEAVSRRFRDIPVDACYSSDLTRTSLTARSVYEPKGLPLLRDPAFREVGLGRWEDLPFGYLDTFEPEDMRRFNRDPASWHVEGSEPFPVYTGRFIGGMERAAARHPGQTIAIFCHGAVLRGVLAVLFFGGDCTQVPYCDNTAVSKLFWDGRSFTREYLNDNSHLPEELSTFARQKWWRQGEKKDYNLWYRLPEPGETLPADMPELRGTENWLAMLEKQTAGLLSLDLEAGRITQLWMRPGFRDRGLEDQLLGQAISRLRPLGHKRLTICPRDAVPSEFLARYCGQSGTYMTLALDPADFAAPQWQPAGLSCQG